MASQNLPGDPLAQKEFYWRRYCHNVGEKQRQSGVQGMCWVFSVCPQIHSLPFPAPLRSPRSWFCKLLYKRRRKVLFSPSLSLWHLSLATGCVPSLWAQLLHGSPTPLAIAFTGFRKQLPPLVLLGLEVMASGYG